jgi:hypothetical protein
MRILRHRGINRQNSSGERRQYVTVNPGPKDRALLLVTTLGQKGSYL